MQQDKNTLVKIWLEKAKAAIKSSKDNIKSDNLSTVQNRVYYAVFYSTMALAYFEDFHTSKHSELMGWFNKNYIKTAIFPKEMGTLYKNTFNDRNLSDYTINFAPELEGLLDHIEKAEYFIKAIEGYIEASKQ